MATDPDLRCYACRCGKPVQTDDMGRWHAGNGRRVPCPSLPVQSSMFRRRVAVIVPPAPLQLTMFDRRVVPWRR